MNERLHILPCLCVIDAVEAFRQHRFDFRQGTVRISGNEPGINQSCLKVFLTAGAQVRAQRRYKQLIQRGISANLADLLRDLQERDKRDRERAVSPTRPAPDARLLDSSDQTIEQTVRCVLDWYCALKK